MKFLFLVSLAVLLFVPSAFSQIIIDDHFDGEELNEDNWVLFRSRVPANGVMEVQVQDGVLHLIDISAKDWVQAGIISAMPLDMNSLPITIEAKEAHPMERIHFSFVPFGFPDAPDPANCADADPWVQDRFGWIFHKDFTISLFEGSVAGDHIQLSPTAVVKDDWHEVKMVIEKFDKDSGTVTFSAVVNPGSPKEIVLASVDSKIPSDKVALCIYESCNVVFEHDALIDDVLIYGPLGDGGMPVELVGKLSTSWGQIKIGS